MPTLTLGSNTYVSLAEAEAYFAEYPCDSWDGEEEEKEQSLVNATQAIDALYGEKYMSELAEDSQPLLFPRVQFYDMNRRLVSGLPTSLKNAVCELAALSLTGVDIFPEPSQAGLVQQENLQVGGIAIGTTYFKAPHGASFEGFRKVDLMIRPLLNKPSAVWRIGK